MKLYKVHQSVYCMELYKVHKYEQFFFAQEAFLFILLQLSQLDKAGFFLNIFEIAYVHEYFVTN